jgi:hypothetical protein
MGISYINIGEFHCNAPIKNIKKGMGLPNHGKIPGSRGETAEQTDMHEVRRQERTEGS